MKFFKSITTTALALLTVTLFQANVFAAQHSESREIFWRNSDVPRPQKTSNAQTENPSPESRPDTVKNDTQEPTRGLSSSNDENSKANEAVKLPHHRGGLQDR